MKINALVYAPTEYQDGVDTSVVAVAVKETDTVGDLLRRTLRRGFTPATGPVEREWFNYAGRVELRVVDDRAGE